MPQEAVPTDIPRAIRRKAGANITFINQLATDDIYFDNDYGRLAAAVAGSVGTANGTLIAKSGGQVQFSAYPGVVYVRSNTATFIEVQP
jgi:hypothetical protein